MGPSPDLLFSFGIRNSIFMTSINILYGSQTSPVVVRMQNEINIRITSLYGSQPSSVVFLHSQQRHYDQN